MIALLNRSTTTRRLSKSLERGRSTIKSMVILSQIPVGVWMGTRGIGGVGNFLVL